MTFNEIMSFLEEKGSEQSKKVLMRHGAKEPFFGVKVADLKTIQKKVKKDYDLSMQLYRTGNSDAMYLAGLIADPELMTDKDIREWAEGAYWYMISDYTVADVSAKSKYGFDLALEWIDSDNEFIESAGWSTLAAYLSYFDPDEKQEKIMKELLERAKNELQDSKNRVRYSMNGFIIACGSFSESFTELAFNAADSIGKVNVDMGGTACKVPPARQTIEKVIQKGKQGSKRNLKPY